MRIQILSLSLLLATACGDDGSHFSTPDGALGDAPVSCMRMAAAADRTVVTIDRGSLAGSVLVSELSSVRRLVFGATGNVDDTGSLALGSGLENVAGAIGVTP